MNTIVQLDRQLFNLINNSWNNDVFDTIMPLLRTRDFWLPLYLFLLLFTLINFGKRAWIWALVAGATVILSNYISSDLIKENIFRLRPCNDITLADQINVLVGYRPQSSSFTSSHATNHFAMASYFYFTLRKITSGWCLLFFIWAASICYAQVYVGVHFPLDVAAGGIIGLIFGYLTAKSFNKYYGLL